MSARPAPPPERSTGRQGNYAGAVSRAVAFGADVGAVWLLYTAGAAALSLFVELVAGHSIRLSNHIGEADGILAVWAFIYFAGQWALSGQTLGMAVFGLRVVLADGSPITPRAAVIRALTFPLSIIVFGLGFLGILTNRQRHAWHDKFAGTVVVYDWDARAARLRWLAKREIEGGGGTGSAPRSDGTTEAADTTPPTASEQRI